LVIHDYSDLAKDKNFLGLFEDGKFCSCGRSILVKPGGHDF